MDGEAPRMVPDRGPDWRFAFFPRASAEVIDTWRAAGLQEHERVRLIITSEAEWQRQFAALLEQVQSKTDRFAPDEIEADISAAAKESRSPKLDETRRC